MSQRVFQVPEIGEVLIARRRGSRHLRLSISPAGKVRLGMPYFTPYGVGLRFIESKKSWLKEQLQKTQVSPIKPGGRIGKLHTVYFQPSQNIAKTAQMHISTTAIEIRSPLDIMHPDVQAKLRQACERALRIQAEKLLPIRLAEISRRYQLPYSSVRIRKLTSRWGSCSKDNTITLSYFLMQLPWNLIDYVLLHELAHTKILHHGPRFWDFMEQRMPGSKSIQNETKAYKPIVQSQ